MDSKKLNTLLWDEFPELRDRIQDEISWQEGIETGSHVVYGDVLTPYIREMEENGNDAQLKKIFAFLEKLLSLGDEYAEEVIQLSVIESIIYDEESENKYKKYLGTLTGKVVNY